MVTAVIAVVPFARQGAGVPIAYLNDGRNPSKEQNIRAGTGRAYFAVLADIGQEAVKNWCEMNELGGRYALRVDTW